MNDLPPVANSWTIGRTVKHNGEDTEPIQPPPEDTEPIQPPPGDARIVLVHELVRTSRYYLVIFRER